MLLHQLSMSQEVIETNNKKMICFIKLHATWSILCHYAEELNMRAPLQVRVIPTDLRFVWWCL
jgi:anoctamin-7